METNTLIAAVLVTVVACILGSIIFSRQKKRPPRDHGKQSAAIPKSKAAQTRSTAHTRELQSTEEDSYDVITSQMVAELTDVEKEKAARSSYRYFIAALKGDSNVHNAARDHCAKRMARRHLVADDGNMTVALRKMKETIKYREDMEVDIIRHCFYVKHSRGWEELESLRLSAKKGTTLEGVEKSLDYHRKGLEKELSEGKLFIRGRTKFNNPLYVVLTHRFVSGFSKEWYMKYNIYTLERAIAIVEKATDGKIEKVAVAFDFGQYNAKMRPPLGLSKNLQFCLRDHYPERVEKVILIDTPFIFRAFWSLIKPFIDPNTKEKVVFVTGSEQKKEIVGNLVDQENAMPFMLPGGKLESDIDIDNYLHQTPFDQMVR